MAKIQDVARLAGVSVSTVSRAFRDDTMIQEETRQRVLSVAKEMGYYPNLLARGLKSSKNKMVGFLGSLDTPFYVNIILAVERELQRNGYQLLVGSSIYNVDREQHYLEMMASAWVSGVILTPFFEESDPGIQMLCQRDIPVVQLFRSPYTQLDSVVVDDEQGAYLATKALLDHGHRRILLFDIPVSNAPQRSNGYRRAFCEKGLPVDENMIVIVRNEDVPEVIRDLQPTGIITGVYEQGKCVYQYVKENNIRIPEQLSLVFFDDAEWMDMLGIDAIAQPIDRVGVVASHLLLERMSGERTEPKRMVLQPNYIARGSVTSPQTGD